MDGETELPLTLRQVGEDLGMDHLEVNRRVRKGQIEAYKQGWIWLVPKEAVEKARKSDWYQRRLARRQREQPATN